MNGNIIFIGALKRSDSGNSKGKKIQSLDLWYVLSFSSSSIWVSIVFLFRRDTSNLGDFFFFFFSLIWLIEYLRKSSGFDLISELWLIYSDRNGGLQMQKGMFYMCNLSHSNADFIFLTTEAFLVKFKCWWWFLICSPNLIWICNFIIVW